MDIAAAIAAVENRTVLKVVIIADLLRPVTLMTCGHLVDNEDPFYGCSSDYMFMICSDCQPTRLLADLAPRQLMDARTM
jgi:hypothetical protein